MYVLATYENEEDQMVDIVTCKNVEDQFKIKVLQWSQQIFVSLCRFVQTLSMRVILLEIQTHQRFYGCLCYQQESRRYVQTMNALEWSQHYTSILRFSRAANSTISDMIWPKFNFIQAFIGCLCYLQVCRSFIKKRRRLSHHNISPIINLWGVFKGS